METMGLEPTTPCLQSRCSSHLSYVPATWDRTPSQCVVRPPGPTRVDRRYSPVVIGAGVATVRARTVQIVLPIGIAVSGVLMAMIGGWPGVVIGLAQLIAAAALARRPVQPGVLAVTAVLLVLAPLAALRSWLARTPLGCSCFGAPAHPPGILSLTGLVALLGLGLVGLAAWSARASAVVAGRVHEAGHFPTLGPDPDGTTP